VYAASGGQRLPFDLQGGTIMALFGKKTENCAICGKEVKTGLLRGLFQKKIENQLICKECYGTVDLPVEVECNMTLNQFRQYIAFRDQNQKLKDVFQVTRQVDFGVFEDKIVFDNYRGLMCMNKDLSTTVFEAKDIKSFRIKEDEKTIFAGSPEGLQTYESSVPVQIQMLQPQINAYLMQKRRFEAETACMNDEQRQKVQHREPKFRAVDPFQKFKVEIRMEHPFWSVLTAELNAPDLNNENPDTYAYMNAYNQSFGIMQDLADALMELAFSR
jgi:hypothetical protein